MGYPKKHRGRRKMGSKKRRARKKNKKKQFLMSSILKARSISIWIFVVPFVAVNACLLITTQFHSLIESQYRIFMPFPYIDGGVSISRTARYFPTYLIFKPAMFLTSYLFNRIHRELFLFIFFSSSSFFRAHFPTAPMFFWVSHNLL